MAGVVIVDWLGRGGITQTTEAWVEALADRNPLVVTRSGRDLSGRPDVIEAGGSQQALAAHWTLARRAAGLIRSEHPSLVVIQNYVIPPLEAQVHRAARAVGAKVVFVVHDHQLHGRTAGTRAGLRSQIAHADVVIAHSRYVANRVGVSGVSVLPLPVQVGMVALAGATTAGATTAGATTAGATTAGVRSSPVDSSRRMALHFGVIRRDYKGTDTVLRLAASGILGWRFVVAGKGTPPTARGVEAVEGYLDSARLVGLLCSATAVLLPYRFATQSGAVALAQSVGCVCVVAGVGGIPEQVADGSTGVLVAADAPDQVWRDALVGLEDEGRRSMIAAAAEKARWADHHRFVEAVRAL
ncbi:MAG: glycosyltransferase [Acidimicrobiales bacterium]